MPAPTRRILASSGVRLARHSVVRVFGTACGLGVEGSGWVVAPDLVITNAHVVAGEADTRIQIDGVGPGHPARVLVFDPRNDIAVLQVPGLGLRPLAVAADPHPGTSAAILGYPLDGAFDAEPGRLGQTETVDTQDAYGDGHVSRSITALRGRVRPGNSGGPMVDGHGQVVATVFAALTGTPRAGGFAVPDTLVRGAVRRAAGGVGAGRHRPLRRLKGATRPAMRRPERAAVCAPPASGVDCPRTFLGHLSHHVEPDCPQELRVVMGEVSLCRVEQLLFGVALQLRPTFAIGDPAVLSVDWAHIPLSAAGSRRPGNGAPLVAGGRGPRWPRWS